MRHNRWLLAVIAGAILWTVGCGSDSIDTINKINAERQQLRSRYVDLQKQKEALKVRVSTPATEATTSGAKPGKCWEAIGVSIISMGLLSKSM